jgi:CBS domain-containing protein
VVAAGVDPRATRVSVVMSSRLETVAPDLTIGDVMGIFTNKRCRHLPVVAEGELLGLISIGDVSRWLADTHRAEAEQLRQYIAGGYPT